MSAEIGTGRHRRMWCTRAISRDLGTLQAPGSGRHAAPHVHEWRFIAEFTGMRASIEQCAACEETRTSWTIA